MTLPRTASRPPTAAPNGDRIPRWTPLLGGRRVRPWLVAAIALTGAALLVLPFDLLRHDVFMTMRPVPDASIHEIVDETWLPLLTAEGSRSPDLRA